MQAHNTTNLRKLARVSIAGFRLPHIRQANQSVTRLTYRLQGGLPLFRINGHRLHLPGEKWAIGNRHQTERFRQNIICHCRGMCPGLRWHNFRF